MNVHGVNYEAFNSIEWITYQVSLADYDTETQQLKSLECEMPYLPQYCQITMSRAYTPILYSLAPPIVYYGAEMAFWIDPRAAQNKRSTSFPELPFTEVRLNGFGVDFEGYLEEDVILGGYTKNQVRGRMGAITPDASAEVSFRFRVGYA